MFVVKVDTIPELINVLIKKWEAEKLHYVTRESYCATKRDKSLWQARQRELAEQIRFLQRLHIETTSGEIIQQGQ